MSTAWALTSSAPDVIASRVHNVERLESPGEVPPVTEAVADAHLAQLSAFHGRIQSHERFDVGGDRDRAVSVVFIRFSGYAALNRSRTFHSPAVSRPDTLISRSNRVSDRRSSRRTGLGSSSAPVLLLWKRMILEKTWSCAPTRGVTVTELVRSPPLSVSTSTSPMTSSQGVTA